MSASLFYIKISNKIQQTFVFTFTTLTFNFIALTFTNSLSPFTIFQCVATIVDGNLVITNKTQQTSRTFVFSDEGLVMVSYIIISQ